MGFFMFEPIFIPKKTTDHNMKNMLVGIFGLIMYTAMMSNVK